MSDELLGRVWDNRYAPVRVLGSGGQGHVVLAVDRVQQREVAIKLRPVGEHSDRSELLNEARVLLTVTPHPGIAVVRADFFDNGFHGLVMDYVAGPTLRESMTHPPTNDKDRALVLGWIRALGNALDHLHSQSPTVLHGDVKPANVVLAERTGQPVLVDFGMAAGSAGYGTRSFAAPEMARHESRPASDVYGLAATAFALLAGERPGPGAGAQLSPAVRDVLARGLSTDPDARPPTPGHFTRELGVALGVSEPVAAGRRGTRATVALGVGIAAVGLIAAALFVVDRSPRKPIAATSSSTTTPAVVASVAVPAGVPTSEAKVAPATTALSTPTAPVGVVASFALLEGSGLRVVRVGADSRTTSSESLSIGASGWTAAARVRDGQLFLYRRSDGHNRLVSVDERGAVVAGRTNPEVPASFSHVVGLGTGVVFFYRQSDGYASTHRYGEQLRLADQDGYPAAQNLAAYDRVVAGNGVVVLYRSGTGASRVVRVDDQGGLRVGPEHSLPVRWSLIAPLADGSFLGLNASGDASIVRVRGDAFAVTSAVRFAGTWTHAAQARSATVLYSEVTGRVIVVAVEGEALREIASSALPPSAVIASVD